ncbi:hypothetical protein ACSFA2_00015 [Variovorax sp. LT2P21]|uniref:hypothetical protein n=1 Tax=Variovorax sp. LT2P21 TaxID=3443731 RepID=UPI003F46E127
MESTEHLIGRLTRERDAAVAALESNRRAAAPHALIAADRLLGTFGIPWWITLEATLRVVVSSCALREHPIVGLKAIDSAVADAAALLSRIDAVLPEHAR